MSKQILDNSGTYLRIFTEQVPIDYTLPKYRVVLFKKKEEDKKKEETDLDRYSFRDLEFGSVDPAVNGYDKRKALEAIHSEKLIDREFFEKMTADDLTLFIDDERSHEIYRKFTSMMSEYPDNSFVNSLHIVETNSINVSQLGNTTLQLVNAAQAEFESEENNPGWFKRLLGHKKKSYNQIYSEKLKEQEEEEEKKKKEEESKPTYEMNVIEFFDQVKLTTEQETVDYYNRIGPYLVALKRAKEMGQKALIDGWVGRIFIAKYESFLRAKGFHHKITEEQMVQFVKKTEKGVTLTWIKNFPRPIPDDVAKKKLEADSLHVFDNYVILHYDPQGKVYAKTQEEKEKERAKKADPIMFGVIWESRDLYYIADWTDQYCDLTLDKFLEVSGLLRQDLQIDEKIQL